MSEEKKKTKKTESTESRELEEIKNEFQFLKSGMYDLNRRIDMINQRMDQLIVYFENHGHIKQESTGEPIFLQELYEKKMAARKAQMKQEEEDLTENKEKLEE